MSLCWSQKTPTLAGYYLFRWKINDLVYMGRLRYIGGRASLSYTDGMVFVTRRVKELVDNGGMFYGPLGKER